MIQKELGREPDPEKLPVDYEDLNDFNKDIVKIYNSMGSRVTEVGFIGKDYCILDYLLEVYDMADQAFCIDLINMVDAHNIKASAREREKRGNSKNKK